MRKMETTKNNVKAPKYGLSEQKKWIFEDNQKVGLKGAIL
jgi:hypothetical protein